MMLPDNKILAAVDIGSNSIHIVIARVVKGSLQIINSHRERTQLALGLGEELLLTNAAMQRGWECLQRMAKLLSDAQPDQVRAVATYALRAAHNRDVFLEQAEALLGYSIEVIAGREEARLIFQAIAHTEKIERESLVIDIGGGSTELAVGVGFDPQFCASCAMGCVNYREQFFSKGFTREDFAQANRAALQSLEAYLPQLGRREWHSVYATSGSAKALVQVAMQDEGTDASVSLQQLLSLREKIIAHNGVSWLGELGISDSRTLLVPGGLAIMIACMQCLTIDRIYYRDVALREGVLYEMLEQMRHPNIRVRTRKSMQSRYSTDTAHAERVTDTVSAILQRVPAAWLGSKDDVHEILYEAAHLHEVGLQISAGGLQKHSAYILASSDLPGYNEDQQLLLASLVGAHRKKIRLDDLPKLRIIEPPALLRLIIVLRLAIIFNITRLPIDLAYVELSVKPDGLHIVVDEKLIATQQLLEADLQRESDLLAAVNFNLIIR